MAHDSSFRLQSRDPETDYDPNRGTVIWRLKDMQPQQRLEFSASFVATIENRDAVIEMQASSRGLITPKRIIYTITNTAAGPPVNNGGLPAGTPEAVSCRHLRLHACPWYQTIRIQALFYPREEVCHCLVPPVYPVPPVHLLHDPFPMRLMSLVSRGWMSLSNPSEITFGEVILFHTRSS